jgi:formate dehydrogenase subunit gamma
MPGQVRGSSTGEDAAMLSAAETGAVEQAIVEAAGLAGPLLPTLHGVQDRLGWIPPAAVSVIAHALNLSRAEVHGVVTFYGYFRSSPPGRQVIYLCRAEACQAVGARTLAEHACNVLQTDFGGNSPDGRYSLEPVYCLGNCACGPSMMLDGNVHAAVTPERFDEILAGEVS